MRQSQDSQLASNYTIPRGRNQTASERKVWMKLKNKFIS